jgi:hypothetical protein
MQSWISNGEKYSLLGLSVKVTDPNVGNPRSRGRAFALVVVAAFFEPTPREGKPLFAHERAVA